MHDVSDPSSDALDAKLALGQIGDTDLAVQIVFSAPFPMVLTDPSQSDNPIIFVNKAFERATGYSATDSIGRNCRFLQGEQTDPRAIAQIREALATSREISVDLLNYRKDGSPFWNRLLIAPLLGEDGTPKFFFGVQKVLGTLTPEENASSTDFLLREIQHRVKNHLLMVVGLIRLQSRDEISAEGFDKLARRVESLQLLYEELNASGGENRDAVALGSYLSRIVHSVCDLDGQGNLLVDFEVESFAVPLETAVRCGLIISEAVTNAIQHAFADRETGRIQLRVNQHPDGRIHIALADNGIGLPDDVKWPNDKSMGGRIITELAGSLGGSLGMEGGPDGSVVTLDLPPSVRGKE